MAGNKKRLFFALWPDAATRETIAGRTRDAVTAAGGRAVPEANLHLTLAFLHNVDVRRVPCVTDAARRAACAPFDLTLTRIDTFARSRILWLAPPEPDGAAAGRLAARLWRALEVCGFEPERRPFRPHVTLARKIEAGKSRSAIEPVAWRVTSFALMESLPAGPRPRYAVVETFALDPG